MGCPQMWAGHHHYVYMISSFSQQGALLGTVSKRSLNFEVHSKRYCHGHEFIRKNSDFFVIDRNEEEHKL